MYSICETLSDVSFYHTLYIVEFHKIIVSRHICVRKQARILVADDISVTEGGASVTSRLKS